VAADSRNDLGKIAAKLGRVVACNRQLRRKRGTYANGGCKQPPYVIVQKNTRYSVHSNGADNRRLADVDSRGHGLIPAGTVY